MPRMPDAIPGSARFLAVLTTIFILFLMPGSSAAACVCGSGDGKPTLNEPITIDGDMSDWGNVFADEDNNVCDGPAGGLTDLDAPVQSTGRDIVQFTFTYDSTQLYFYTERTGSSTNTQTFLYYADTNDNGYQEDGEPVIVAEWKGSNRLVTIYIADYNPVDTVNGDPTVDAAGLGDGYALPGNLKNISSAIGTYSGTYGSADGMAMEFGISWMRLGFSGPVGHTIHVSSTNANKNASSLGDQIDDNLGGCGGGGGTIRYADLDFSGAYSLQGARGSTVYGIHHLVNLGNGDDAFSFAYTTAGLHSPSVTFYLDDGDAIFGTGDPIIAGTVSVAVGGSVDIIIAYGIGPTALGTATVTTTATSEFSLTQSVTISDLVVDTVEVIHPDVVTVKSISDVTDARAYNSVAPKAIPGASVTYLIQVTNVGNGGADADSVVVADTVPSHTELYVGNGSVSPVLFTDSGSGLSFTFSGLGDGNDDIAFTSDSGPSPAYTYTPTGGPDGYDSAVTGLRVNPKGVFSPAPGSSFTIQYNARVR